MFHNFKFHPYNYCHYYSTNFRTLLSFFHPWLFLLVYLSIQYVNHFLVPYRHHHNYPHPPNQRYSLPRPSTHERNPRRSEIKAFKWTQNYCAVEIHRPCALPKPQRTECFRVLQNIMEYFKRLEFSSSHSSIGSSLARCGLFCWTISVRYVFRECV